MTPSERHPNWWLKPGRIDFIVRWLDDRLSREDLVELVLRPWRCGEFLDLVVTEVLEDESRTA